MAEYITKEQALELLDDGDMYARKALTKMKPADVIEREKIDKAIEEIWQYNANICISQNAYITKQEVAERVFEHCKKSFIQTLKRNIGE